MAVGADKALSVDVGGQWVGPLHTRMISLLEELNVPLVAQYGTGADLLDDGASVRRSLNLGTNIPRVHLLALIETQLSIISGIQRRAEPTHGSILHACVSRSPRCHAPSA